MSGPSYRVGPFLIDRAAYRVTRDGRVVDLTPKLLDLLLYLLDRPATLVTKEELLDALWPGANVTENALAQAVSELRQALGDDAAAPTYIKTIARRGYRFIAPVERVEEATSETADHSSRRITAADEARTIAVMDFVNVSGESDYAWLSAGIAETVTGDLRSLGEFKVIERSRVGETARRTDGSLQQIGADLRARLAVVGSFQCHGERIRITARVVDIGGGEALADAKVDGPLDSLFDLQDRIVAQLSTELGLPARSVAASRIGARETASLEAYRAYTEGSLRLESLDVRDIPRAMEDFHRAVSLDERYALAYTGLASAEFAQYETTRSDNEPAQSLLDCAIEHARHAVELDEALAEAHAALALPLVSAWRTREAVAAAERAVSLEPSNWRHWFRLGHASWGDARLQAAARTRALYPEFAFSHFQAAMVHVARRHFSKGDSVLREGLAVQDQQGGRRTRFPALGLHWLLGLTRLAQEDAAEALIQFDRELHLADPHRLYGREYSMHAHQGRGAALLTAGRVDEAIDAFRRAIELYPDHAQSHLGLAQALRSKSATSAAESHLAKAEEAATTLARSRPIEAAMVRALLLVTRGHFEEAGRTLELVLADASPGFAGWTLPIEPLLKQLRGNQRFTAVLRRLADRAR